MPPRERPRGTANVAISGSCERHRKQTTMIRNGHGGGREYTMNQTYIAAKPPYPEDRQCNYAFSVATFRRSGATSLAVLVKWKTVRIDRGTGSGSISLMVFDVA